jgi:hypothetical protein
MATDEAAPGPTLRVIVTEAFCSGGWSAGNNTDNAPPSGRKDWTWAGTEPTAVIWGAGGDRVPVTAAAPSTL